MLFLAQWNTWIKDSRGQDVCWFDQVHCRAIKTTLAEVEERQISKTPYTFLNSKIFTQSIHAICLLRMPWIHDCCSLPGRKQDKPESVHLSQTWLTESCIVKVKDLQQFLIESVFGFSSFCCHDFQQPSLPPSSSHISACPPCCRSSWPCTPQPWARNCCTSSTSGYCSSNCF